MSDPAPSPCGYCGSIGSWHWFDSTDLLGKQWNWRVCETCGAAFLSPRPTPDQLRVAYDTAYYGAEKSKFGFFSETFIKFCRRGRARRIGRGLHSDATVLDIGCGNGGFLAALHRRGITRLHGTELPGNSAQRAAKRGFIHLKIGELAAGDFPDHSLDLVTLFHVFEHLVDPQGTLALVHRALKPKGRLVLSFPNGDSNQVRFFRGAWLHLDPPRHLFLFGPAPFRKAMLTAGFAVVSERHFSIEQNPYAFVQSLLNRVLRPRDMLYERLKGNRSYAPRHGTLSVAAQALAALTLAPAAVALDGIDALQRRGATVEFTLVKLPR
jgi:SAM-dependent methyltransferase